MKDINEELKTSDSDIKSENISYQRFLVLWFVAKVSDS